MGTLNDLLQGTSKGFWAGGAGAPVDTLTLALNALIAGGGYAGHKMGLLNKPPDLIEKPVGGSEWIADKMRSGGLLADNPGSTADNIGNVLGGLLGPLTAVKAPQIARGLLQAETPLKGHLPLRALRASDKIEPNMAASKSPQMLDPKPTAQRPFNDDYPQSISGPDGSRLAFDIDGNPLSQTSYIAGRRTLGGMDESLSRIDQNGIASASGIRTFKAPRTGSDLGGDAGRYYRDRNSIYLDQSLDTQQADRVFSHEIGHSIDDRVQKSISAAGSKIPTTGIKKDLLSIYEQLNTPGWFKPGRGMTPKGQNYGPDVADGELIAEAIRAYGRDPNYMKTNFPDVAKRIRQHVNTNQNLKDVVQFNSAGLGLGLLSQDDWPGD